MAVVVVAAPFVLPALGIAATSVALTAGVNTVAAGATAGAAAGTFNESLDEHHLGWRCIGKAALKGAALVPRDHRRAAHRQRRRDIADEPLTVAR